MPTTTNTANNTFSSNRTFGVEIECSNITIERAAEALRAAGLTASAESLNHTTRSYWKVVRDGSVENGCEVVSPVLSGEAGLAQVRIAAAALAGAGASANRTCGLHVHVGASDLSGKEILNIARRYNTHEAAIDRVMPVSRRGNNNSYCASVSNIMRRVNELDAQTTVNPHDICVRFDRYHKVNLYAFMVHGTIEFRQHSGTVNGDKIVNWIMFCVNFVEESRLAAAVQTVTAPAVSSPRVRRNAISTKMDQLQTLFARAGAYQTVTSAAIAAELGISEPSVPSYVSMFRMAHPDSRLQARRGYGYYTTSPMPLPGAAAAPVAPVVVVPTPVRRADTNPFANLPASARSHFSEREADYATN